MIGTALKTAVTLCAIALLAAPTRAEEPRYDRKLEDAVKAIVAGRIGDLRTGFGIEGTTIPAALLQASVASNPDEPTASTQVVAGPDTMGSSIVALP